MDIERPDLARARRRRRVILTTCSLLAVAAVTFLLAQLKPAAPTVERTTIYTDTVKRGEMLRQVRGSGTLVPEEIRWIPVTTAGRVQTILLSKFAFKNLLDKSINSDIFDYISQGRPMKPRTRLPDPERRARSRLTQIVHEHPFLSGSLVHMQRTCGKPGCRCSRGELHPGLYLALRVGGTRRMIHVPQAMEQVVRQWVANYQEA